MILNNYLNENLILKSTSKPTHHIQIIIKYFNKRNKKNCHVTKLRRNKLKELYKNKYHEI